MTIRNDNINTTEYQYKLINKANLCVQSAQSTGLDLDHHIMVRENRQDYLWGEVGTQLYRLDLS